MRKNEMNAKKLLVSFLLIASVLFLATASVSAATATGLQVFVDDVEVEVTDGTPATIDASVIAGETIEVEVRFTADGDESDVRLKATLEGDKTDVIASKTFDVEDGMTYVKRLVIKVPSDLDEDEVSAERTLNIELLEDDNDYVLNVQKPSYDFAVKSVSTSNSINAGQSMPVEVVLKNVGYNNADDVYVTVSIPELNIAKSAYLGDLASMEGKRTYTITSPEFGVIEVEEGDEDNENTASVKLNLEVPYTAKTGVYTLTVEVENDETTSTVAKEITIENGVSDLAIRSGNDLVVLNPTNQLKVYTVSYNGNDVTVVVPAVSSKNVAIEVPEGDYNFDVTVLSGAAVLSTVAFSGTSQGTVELTNPVFVLTVILSVVFLVLLVVLVVLITKKPQKAEEFGESYY